MPNWVGFIHIEKIKLKLITIARFVLIHCNTNMSQLPFRSGRLFAYLHTYSTYTFYHLKLVLAVNHWAVKQYDISMCQVRESCLVQLNTLLAWHSWIVHICMSVHVVCVCACMRAWVCVCVCVCVWGVCVGVSVWCGHAVAHLHSSNPRMFKDLFGRG